MVSLYQPTYDQLGKPSRRRAAGLCQASPKQKTSETVNVLLTSREQYQVGMPQQWRNGASAVSIARKIPKMPRTVSLGTDSSHCEYRLITFWMFEREGVKSPAESSKEELESAVGNNSDFTPFLHCRNSGPSVKIASRLAKKAS